MNWKFNNGPKQVSLTVHEITIGKDSKGLNPKDFVKFQTERQITKAFKQTLYDLEDLCECYDLPEDEFRSIRKRVLDRFNDVIRNLSDELDKYIVEIDTDGNK